MEGTAWKLVTLFYLLPFFEGWDKEQRKQGNQDQHFSWKSSNKEYDLKKPNVAKKAVLNLVTGFAPRRCCLGGVAQGRTGFLLQALHYCMVATYTQDVLFCSGETSLSLSHFISILHMLSFFSKIDLSNHLV